MRTRSWRTSSRAILASVLLCLCAWSPTSAHGQSRAGADEDARIADIVRRIRTTPIPNPGASSKELGGLIALLAQGEALMRTQESIATFRREDDQDVIGRLSQLALLPQDAVRRLATRILVNVVDNTTLCVILDKLVDEKMRDNNDARFNLLQVVLVVVANNAHYEENDRWAEGMATRVKALIDKKPPDDVEDSNRLLESIRDEVTRADRKKAGRLEREFPAEFAGCMKLPNAALFSK